MRLESVKKSFFIICLFSIVTFSSFSQTSHKVSSGDTLYSISKKYNVSLDELKKANNIDENNKIIVGQTLKIPTKDNEEKTSSAITSTSKTTTTSSVNKINSETYIVEKGDTLYGIARRSEMSVTDLLELNNLTKDSVIKVGQKIKIKKTSSDLNNTQLIDEKKDSSTSTTKKNTEGNVKKEEIKTSTSSSNSSSSKPSVNEKMGIWPVSNPSVTKVKGKASGVQLSAKINETVKCVSQGTVMYIGLYRGFGQVVFVQSKTGIIYVYAGLGSVNIKKGDYVMIGNEIGTAGIDSISGRSQITFMVFQNGQPVDPEKAPRN